MEKGRSTPINVDNPPPYSPPLDQPPPLPPRETDHLLPSASTESGGFHAQPTDLSWSAQDPRNASTESIVPLRAGPTDKRVLLLIYVHGFMGDETSFQSFPAHVHNAVSPLVRDTHVVHTKIYPKYRSRKHIHVARDNFSEWLAPHEGKDVDVILCGHSMGGLLSAEVVLLPPASHTDTSPLKHRILGTLNFDVPFLGLHPGVIVSGISSLFRTEPPKAAAGQIPDNPVATSSDGAATSSDLHPVTSSSQVSSLSIPDDPNYNPPFANDVNLPVRKGWENTLHFIQKHSDGLTRATKSYVKSHLEFGGAMADHVSLRARYRALRALEDVNPADNRGQFRPPRRVRFVNYYTASTGIRKEPSSREKAGEETPGPILTSNNEELGPSTSISPNLSPRISIEDTTLQTPAPAETPSPQSNHSHIVAESMGLLDPSPYEHESTTDEEETKEIEASSSSISRIESSGASGNTPNPIDSSDQPTTSAAPIATQAQEATSTDIDTHTVQDQANDPVSDPAIEGLPPIPEAPKSPPPFDASQYADKDARKLAEREHERQRKVHKQQVKDRERTIKERAKLLDKREQQRKKQQRKAEEELTRKAKEEKRRLKKEEEAAYSEWRKELREQEKQHKQEKHDATKAAKAQQHVAESVDDTQTSDAAGDGARNEADKKSRDRKFCLLPARDSRTGRRDKAWVRVFMRDVDEVIAHCGLFDAWREHYEMLVLEVGCLMHDWVAEDRERKGQGEGAVDAHNGDTMASRASTDWGVVEN